MILGSPFARFQKQTLSITSLLNCVWGSSSKYIIHKMVYVCVLNQMKSFPGEEGVLIMYTYYGKGHY